MSQEGGSGSDKQLLQPGDIFSLFGPEVKQTASQGDDKTSKKRRRTASAGSRNSLSPSRGSRANQGAKMGRCEL